MFDRVKSFFKSFTTAGLLNMTPVRDSASIATTLGTPTENKRRTFTQRLTRQYQYRVKMELDTWRNAVESAENILLPRRDDLYKIYRQALEDETLLSEIRKAHIMVQRSPFVVQRKGKDNNDLTRLFKKPWFRLFLRHFLDAEFWGHSVIELIMKDGEVATIDLLPREHVRPETGEILLSVNDTKGIAFELLQSQFGVKILPIGEPFDLGLLKTASHCVIVKNYSQSDWSQYNEKFGMPITVAGTKDMNDTESENMETALAHLGANGYFMPFDVDQVKLLERTGTTGYKTYEDFIQRKENNLAKLINGQTGTSEDKSYVGAAQVHERMLNDYTFSRLTNCQDFINFTLIPFLIENGYPLKKWDEFVFTELLQKAAEPQQPKTTDTPLPTDPNNTEGAGKKKSKAVNPKIAKLYHDTEGCCESPPLGDLGGYGQLDFDLSKLFDKAINWVFKKKEKAEGKIHAATWKANVEKLTQGIDKSFATEYKDDTEKDLHAQLKSNAAVFAAFKNHAQNVELMAALSDADGNLRSFAEFKKQAMGILTNYNVNYLKTEYQTAVASAQMAVQWQDFERTKEDFPYLRYVTVGDERVRKSHQLLDGVTLPIDHEFWDNWYPPNNWNCRCDVQQVGGNSRLKEAEAVPTDAPKTFQNNAGKSKMIFTENHPYFEGLSDDEKENIKNQIPK
jgi:SPP1 gp7 family putative phage head morphogenesis protein